MLLASRDRILRVKQIGMSQGNSENIIGGNRGTVPFEKNDLVANHFHSVGVLIVLKNFLFAT